MKKIAFIVATVALIFSSCSSSDNSYEGPSYQVLPPVGVAETKVNIMDGSEVKGTLDVQNVDIPEEPQYLTGSSKSKSIAGVVPAEGEQGYFSPDGVQEPLVVEGLKPVQTENELAYLRTAIPEAEVYTLWMDPVLNDAAYILPGLGDAGDRLNGKDVGPKPRNMIQLIADYGTNINNLYRAQVREIEETVLGK